MSDVGHLSDLVQWYTAGTLYVRIAIGYKYDYNSASVSNVSIPSGKFFGDILVRRHRKKDEPKSQMVKETAH